MRTEEENAIGKNKNKKNEEKIGKAFYLEKDNRRRKQMRNSLKRTIQMWNEWGDRKMFKKKKTIKGVKKKEKIKYKKENFSEYKKMNGKEWCEKKRKEKMMKEKRKINMRSIKRNEKEWESRNEGIK